MISKAKLADKVNAGKAKLEGNTQVLEQLKSTLVAFSFMASFFSGPWDRIDDNPHMSTIPSNTLR